MGSFLHSAYPWNDLVPAFDADHAIPLSMHTNHLPDYQPVSWLRLQ